MSKIQTLDQKVADLYNKKHGDRADWADWLYDNHVVVVANYASELAKKYNAKVDLARAAALLHDIADVKMERANRNHEQVSLEMARHLMKEAGFSTPEIELVVDDAIRFHSCHGDERPESLEGRILATADSMAHLKTDFYVFAVWNFGKQGESLRDIKDWTLKKIERDLNSKILFDDEREIVRSDYEWIKQLFSRIAS